jgi:hypothetical protein
MFKKIRFRVNKKLSPDIYKVTTHKPVTLYLRRAEGAAKINFTASL